MGIEKFLNQKEAFIIAELSANHNHDYDLAIKTIKAMADAGADAVKIQTYTPDSLVMDVDNEFFGPIRGGLWDGIKRYDLYKQGMLPYEWQPKLKAFAEKLGLLFFSTPFVLAFSAFTVGFAFLLVFGILSSSTFLFFL